MWCPRRRERGATVSAVLLNRPDKHKYTQNKTLSNISHAQILRNRLSPSKPRPLKAQVQDTSSTLRTGVKSRITDDNDILFSFFIYCTLCHFPSLVLWKTPLCVTPPPSEAMSSAALFNCLYLEISASLDHRTPELLECVVRLARGQPPWPPGTSPEDMIAGGQRGSITSRAKRFLSSLVPRYPRERGDRFLRQKSRSCHDLGALWWGMTQKFAGGHFGVGVGLSGQVTCSQYNKSTHPFPNARFLGYTVENETKESHVTYNLYNCTEKWKTEFV